MKTREEVIQALKPSKNKVFVVVLFFVALFTGPIIMGLVVYLQCTEDSSFNSLGTQEKITTFIEHVEWFRPVLLFVLFGVLVWYFCLLKNLRKNKNLIKAIEEGTVILEMAKISEFRYAQEHSSQGGYYRGYYVIAKNEDKSFESDFLPLSSATLYNSAGQELHPYGEEINFSMIMNAVKKYKETWSQEAMMQQFEQDVKEQNPASWEDNYLEYQGNTYHIGENVEIYIDPDNESQYYVNI